MVGRVDEFIRKWRVERESRLRVYRGREAMVRREGKE